MPRLLDPACLARQLPVPTDAQVAPDGSRVLFAVVTTDGDVARSRLWTCAIDGSDLAPLTEPGASDSGARWSPDGRWVAFASDRDPSGEGGWRLCVLPAAGGEPRAVAASPQPIAGVAWSPDGSTLAYSTAVDAGIDNGVVRVTRHGAYKLDGRGYIGDRRNQVFTVPAEGGEPRQVTSGSWEHAAPQWSPDGRRLAMVTALITSSRLSIVDLESGLETVVGPDPGVTAMCSWSPDGRLLVVADPGRTYQLDFFLWQPGAAELRRVTDDCGVQPHAGYPGLMPPSLPVWLDEERVLVHAIRGGRSGLYELRPADGSLRELVSWDAAHLGLSVDSARRLVVQTEQTLDHPDEVFLYDLAGSGRLLSAFAEPVLAGRELPGWVHAPIERDGLQIDAWQLRPPGFDPARRYPVVLDIHGGPNMWHGHQWHANQQLLAAHGYVVVFANPRGSTSYGRDFTGRVFGDWGGEDFGDLMAVVDAVAAEPWADASRLGVRGYSYGGYMTSWTIGHTDRFAAALVGAPCFDLVSMWGTSDIGAAWDDVQWGGSPVENEAWYRERSPSTWAHRASTPTLVVHGEADVRCPIGQGEELFTALLAAGVDTEFARYPDASHLFPFSGRPAQREDFLARELAWFDAHLGTGERPAG